MPVDPLVGSAVIGGVSSLLGVGASSGMNYKNQSKLMAKQYKYQTLLNEQQQQYARENADTQYSRQRDFTSDSWFLNREGMENAGLNAAWMNGSSNPTASVDSAAAPNAGAAPSGTAVPLDFSHSIAEGVGALTSVATSLSDKRLKDSETERNNIDNMTRMQENIARIRQLKANASSSEAKAEYDNALKDLRIQYDKMSVRNQALILDNERSNSDITAQLFGENAQNQLALLRNKVAIAAQEGRIKKKEADNYLRMLDAKLLNMRADTSLKFAQAAVAPTQAEVNKAMVGKLGAETQHQIIENYIQNATKDSVIRAAELAVEEHGPQSLNDYAWSIFNNWDNATTSQKVRAISALPLGFVERALGGASESLGKVSIEGKPQKPKVTVVKHIKGK